MTTEAIDESLYFPPESTATPQQSRSDAQHPVTDGATPAQQLAQHHRILDAVAAKIHTFRVTGEDRLVKTLYLVFTSRLLDKQVSAVVKGHSSSGKSYTVEAVTKLFPNDAFVRFTAMSEHALVYSKREYAHRTLIMYEATGLRENSGDDMGSYFIRTLLSEGRIEYEATVKDKATGQFTTQEIVKEGPTNLVLTTTKVSVHAENETRLLSLATNDSSEQTAQVMLALADESTQSDDGIEDWCQLQHWLAGAEHRVTIPYAKLLAELIPPAAVRLRRDFGALLALIRTHAVLHQATREQDRDGRIIATVDDYEVVRDLVGDVIAEGVGKQVSSTIRETVEAVRATLTDNGATVRAIAEKLKVDKSNASRRLRVAADGGYLTNLEDKRGKPARWVLGDELPNVCDLLPTATQLATVAQQLHLQCCGVAVDLDPIGRERPDGRIDCDRCGGPVITCKHIMGAA